MLFVFDWMSCVCQRFSAHVKHQPAFQLSYICEQEAFVTWLRRAEDRQKRVRCPINEALPSPRRKPSSHRETTELCINSMHSEVLGRQSEVRSVTNCQKWFSENKRGLLFLLVVIFFFFWSDEDGIDFPAVDGFDPTEGQRIATAGPVQSSSGEWKTNKNNT